MTPKHSERAFFPDTITRSERNSVGRLGGIGWLDAKKNNCKMVIFLTFQLISVRWFRGSKDASADLESGVFGSHLAASILRHGSFKSRRGDGIGRSLQRVRRRVERRLNRIGLGKGKKVVGGVEEATGSCKIYSTTLKAEIISKNIEKLVYKNQNYIFS